MNILEKIESLREEMGWNNKQLADKAKLAQSTISMMFKRNNYPTVSTIESLCSAFSITMAQFFSENGEFPDLSPEQVKLLKYWGKLPTETKNALMIVIMSLSKSNANEIEGDLTPGMKVF